MVDFLRRGGVYPLPQIAPRLGDTMQSHFHEFLPAGSTLLFSETLIHATGQIRSDRERAIIITGYGAPMFPYWDDGKLSDGFRRQIPDQLKTLFHGKAHWGRGPRYRTLAEPADSRHFPMGTWHNRTGSEG